MCQHDITWMKKKSCISIISCCRFKSPLFCLLFTCWSCFSRRLLCRWTGEERRGVGHQHLDQNLLWSCFHHQLSHCYSSVEPCPRRGAATYLAPFAITLVALNPMPPRIRRSLILPRRPSTSPRLPLRMAAHSPPSWKRWACRGKTEDVARDTNECSVMSLSCGLSTFSVVAWQRCGHVSDLSRGRRRRDAALALRLHRYAG